MRDRFALSPFRSFAAPLALPTCCTVRSDGALAARTVVGRVAREPVR